MKKPFHTHKYNDLDSRIPVERPQSWRHLMECLYGDTYQPDIRCHRSNLIFRGLSNSKFRLLTKLQRNAGDTEDGIDHVRVVEKPIIRNFVRYASSSLTEERTDSLWKWLSIMQYYNAPTRLIDWTSSPFVALHFAVEDESLINEDGVVWCINPNELSLIDVPQDFLAGEGVRYQLYTSAQLDQKIAKAMKSKQMYGMKIPDPLEKRDVTAILDDLDSFSSSDHPFVVFLDPPSEERITNQATIYSILSSSSAVMSDWLERSPHCCKKVIISASLKREIQDKLSQSNITDRVITPGLDGLSNWLTKYYTPRNAKPTVELKSIIPSEIVKTYYPKTWEEILDTLFCDDLAWDDSLQMHRSKFVFRGMPDISYSLLNSLQRMSKGDMNHVRNIEKHIMKNFKRYAHGLYNINKSNIFNWLSTMQHHGAPTRLLDWSQSPMIALFFSVIYSKFDDKDGVIVCINPTEASKKVPKAIRDGDDSFNVLTTEVLENKIKSSDPYMLSALKETNFNAATSRPTTLEDVDSLSNEPFLIFLEPPSLSERIVNQMALFSLLSKPDATLDEWIIKHPESCRRIIIPAQLKAEIRDKLDQTNINERILFPGLEGTSKFLTRYYTYRNK